MADEAPKEDAEKDAKKAPAETAPAAEGGAAVPKKGINVLYIGLGGGAALIVAMSYFLTVAAVETSNASQVPEGYVLVAEEPEKAEGDKATEGKEGEHGDKPAGEGEGGEKKPAEGEHGEAKPEGGEAPKEGDPAAAGQVKGGRYYKLEEIQTNPIGAGLKRFVKAQFSVIMEGKDAETIVAKVQGDDEIKARIKSTVMLLLRSKKIDELEGDANLKIILNEIRRIVDSSLMLEEGQEAKVKVVLIEQFLVQ